MDDLNNPDDAQQMDNQNLWYCQQMFNQNPWYSQQMGNWNPWYFQLLGNQNPWYCQQMGSQNPWYSQLMGNLQNGLIFQQNIHPWYNPHQMIGEFGQQLWQPIPMNHHMPWQFQPAHGQQLWSGQNVCGQNLGNTSNQHVYGQLQTQQPIMDQKHVVADVTTNG